MGGYIWKKPIVRIERERFHRKQKLKENKLMKRTSQIKKDKKQRRIEL